MTGARKGPDANREPAPIPPDQPPSQPPAPHSIFALLTPLDRVLMAAASIGFAGNLVALWWRS